MTKGTEPIDKNRFKAELDQCYSNVTQHDLSCIILYEILKMSENGKTLKSFSRVCANIDYEESFLIFSCLIDTLIELTHIMPFHQDQSKQLRDMLEIFEDYFSVVAYANGYNVKTANKVK